MSNGWLALRGPVLGPRRRAALQQPHIYIYVIFFLKCLLATNEPKINCDWLVRIYFDHICFYRQPMRRQGLLGQKCDCVKACVSRVPLFVQSFLSNYKSQSDECEIYLKQKILFLYEIVTRKNSNHVSRISERFSGFRVYPITVRLKITNPLCVICKTSLESQHEGGQTASPSWEQASWIQEQELAVFSGPLHPVCRRQIGFSIYLWAKQKSLLVRLNQIS